jgi:alcohol dehydrogenase
MSAFFSATRIVWDHGDFVETMRDGLAEARGVRPAVIVDASVLGLSLMSKTLDELHPGLVVPRSGSEPDTTEADELTAQLRASACDAVVGIGGGSVIDLAKAVAGLVPATGPAAAYQGFNLLTEPALPVIAVPTTAGTGSEVTGTAVLVNREKNLKLGINSPMIVPRVAILEPELTLGLPPRMTLSTGMDALSHATESYSARKASGFTLALATRAFDTLTGALPQVLADPHDVAARLAMQIGSTMAGLAVMNAGTGAAHAMAYPLGVHFGVPHSEALTMLLPAIARSCERGDLEIYEGLGTRTGHVSAILDSIVAGSGEEFRLSRYGATGAELPGLADESMNLVSAIDNHPFAFGRDDALSVLEEIL